jgi:Ras-related protein Rab-7A
MPLSPSNQLSYLPPNIKKYSSSTTTSTDDITQTKQNITKHNSVGKTSVLNRYATGKFTGQFKATIGADCVAKEVIVTNPVTGLSQTPVTLQLWDTAGQERFQSLGVAFYRQSDAAVLVYDLTDPVSLDHLAHWKHEFMLQQSSSSSSIMGGSGIPILVLGNKVDKKEQRAVPISVAQEWCRRNGISGYFETSAKTAVNVDDAFTQLATAALEHHERRAAFQQSQQLFIPPPPPSVDLRRDYNNNNNNGHHHHRNDPCC